MWFCVSGVAVDFPESWRAHALRGDERIRGSIRRGTRAVRFLLMFRLIQRLLPPVGSPKTFMICMCAFFGFCHVLCNVPLLAGL